MKYLEGLEKADAERFCSLAAELAENSTCQRSQHGAVIVKDNQIIGKGWNTPVAPKGVCNPCMMECTSNFRTELCNAIHAEHNAILDAYRKGHDLKGSRMFHAKLKNGKLHRTNKPKCTPCSRLIMHTGIAEFVLIDRDRYALYGADEYNDLSYEYCETGLK